MHGKILRAIVRYIEWLLAKRKKEMDAFNAALAALQGSGNTLDTEADAAIVFVNNLKAAASPDLSAQTKAVADVQAQLDAIKAKLALAAQ